MTQNGTPRVQKNDLGNMLESILDFGESSKQKVRAARGRSSDKNMYSIRTLFQCFF